MSVPESTAPARDLDRLKTQLGEFLSPSAQAWARQLKWDRWYLGLAKYISTASKDPSTQTGAVVVGTDGSIVSGGYNGFARGVDDSPERYLDRELKYKLVCHCEINAIIFADRDRLRGATLYTWPFQSCSRCAPVVIQAGIRRCVAPPIPGEKADRWADDMALAKVQFDEAGVRLDVVELTDGPG